MAITTSHRIGRDEVVWSFGPNMEPVLEVEPGSMITLETNDCFTGQIRSEDDLVTETDLSRINSATGPVAVGGLRVCVQHAGGLQTCYYHTSAVYVSPGQTVTRGQLIAAIGLTGVTTGPHVHWELKVNGAPQDPLAY